MLGSGECVRASPQAPRAGGGQLDLGVLTLQHCAVRMLESSGRVRTACWAWLSCIEKQSVEVSGQTSAELLLRVCGNFLLADSRPARAVFLAHSFAPRLRGSI